MKIFVMQPLPVRGPDEKYRRQKKEGGLDAEVLVRFQQADLGNGRRPWWVVRIHPSLYFNPKR